MNVKNALFRAPQGETESAVRGCDTKIRKVVEKYCYTRARRGDAKIRETGAEKFPYL